MHNNSNPTLVCDHCVIKTPPPSAKAEGNTLDQPPLKLTQEGALLVALIRSIRSICFSCMGLWGTEGYTLHRASQVSLCPWIADLPPWFSVAIVKNIKSTVSLLHGWGTEASSYSLSLSAHKYLMTCHPSFPSYPMWFTVLHHNLSFTNHVIFRKKVALVEILTGMGNNDHLLKNSVECVASVKMHVWVYVLMWPAVWILWKMRRDWRWKEWKWR